MPPNSNLLLSLVVAIVALILLARLWAHLVRSRRDGGSWPFYIRKPLSAPEQVLYFRLIRALPDHVVLAQVQVSRVLGVKKGANFHEWNNRINRLSYDFVVCSKDSRPIAAIELDDSSHETDSRRATDAKKDKATRDAGLHIIRWSVKDMPPEDAIQLKLATLELSARRREPTMEADAQRAA